MAYMLHRLFQTWVQSLCLAAHGIWPVRSWPEALSASSAGQLTQHAAADCCALLIDSHTAAPACGMQNHGPNPVLSYLLRTVRVGVLLGNLL